MSQIGADTFTITSSTDMTSWIAEREIIAAESIGAYEEVVADLAVSLARVRELTGVVDA